MPRRWVRRLVVRPLWILAGILALFVGTRYFGGNIGTVVPNRFLRSAQLSPEALGRLIEQRGIRTVLNLRGSNPDQAWYRAERAATLAAGATQIDVPLASDQWLSRGQARVVAELLTTCEPPVLIHCEWGAERTGLLAAFAVLLEPGGDLAQAHAQFSPYYLFLPTREGRTLRGHLDRYAAFLERNRLAHAPERFRRWLETAYHPGSPSRDDWPYDPYPLVLVTRPAAPSPTLARRPTPGRHER